MINTYNIDFSTSNYFPFIINERSTFPIMVLRFGMIWRHVER